MTAASIRARVRAEMTDEIKAVARRHLATDGANLSLRAVARDLGMASSAVYRYFASRDELLTALIIDAYDAVGAAAEQAVDPSAGFLDRFLAVCHAVRDWALANPHEWALIYGSPVPGYQAPTDTVGPAIRVILLIGAIVRDAVLAGGVDIGEPIAGKLGDELRVVAEQAAQGAPPQAVARSLAAWIHMCGAINAELFGQLNNTIDQRREFFDFQMRGAATLIGFRQV
ncbi:TetR/AcrR family transcriptional regulator [Actinoplanes friuliensis]|uniref:Putative TetR-family transcriptional regulator n=1 Tax=Actinoplanes friuliensis DSM 7358 TaxID=1246995 RepID=U5VQM4_9ACTN|nr:TetR/AcrR family transcriptional regulator [Actinoplanes friuliensis]AGZ39124.1 putative TetR-family transcriptional regulator [Actinoplanes friuliensis DSM 7358]